MGNATLVTYRSPTSGSGRELFKDQNGVVVPKILLAWLGRHRRDGCVVFLQVTVPGLAACNNVRLGGPMLSIDVAIIASDDAYENPWFIVWQWLV
ncbi:hypothetical protein V6N13_088707 [Hibiscus sabdariffa]|uniref:Uncharacterized protein n=1 Tax=Hibiscus sabdariffa TaxID=183260 RepID=A0ABR2G044_9ROSI